MRKQKVEADTPLRQLHSLNAQICIRTPFSAPPWKSFYLYFHLVMRQQGKKKSTGVGVIAEMLRSFGCTCLGQFGCLWHQLLHASSNHSPAGRAAGPAHHGPLPAGTAASLPTCTHRARDRKTSRELQELNLFSLSEVHISIDRHFSIQR